MKSQIVVTGYGIISGIGIGKEEHRTSLFNGESGISEKTMNYKDRNVSSSFGAVKNLVYSNTRFLEKYKYLDRIMDLALLATEEAVVQSTILSSNIDFSRVGVIIGTSLGGMLSGDEFHKTWLEQGLSYINSDFLKQYPLRAVADLISENYGFSGMKLIISTACSSGANSVGMAMDTINDGLCDVVIVGGVDPLSRFSFAGFNSLGAISKEPCEPYSGSNGINIGEGAAIFVLEKDSYAKNREAKIVAEVKGYGITADAYHPTAPSINGEGAFRAMNLALKNSKLKVDDLSYVNGHGTGTKANDTSETKAFGNFISENVNIPLVSSKSSVGHTLGAAGAVELAFSILSIEEKKIPPTINFKESQIKGIDFVPNNYKDLEVNNVLSNSFAFGGNNCSVIISKYNSLNDVQKHKEKQEDVVITHGNQFLIDFRVVKTLLSFNELF